MTGNDIFTRCLSLLGYTPSQQESMYTSALALRMPEILNQILCDLRLPPIKGLTDTVNGTELQLDAVCCGCTMLLAFSDGDGQKNRVFAEIYNARRASVLSCTDTIKDTLPKTFDGGA